MAGSRISFLWKDARAAEEYSTGVSLHSHTNRSTETLDFIVKLADEFTLLRKILQWQHDRVRQRHGLEINYSRSYWTPPLTPRLAFDLERSQIEEKLSLQPLVSISDHDNIQAPMLLRTVASARHIPVSVEWSVPFGGDQSFHLGIHNLPSAQATEWMRRMNEFTENPRPGELSGILAALDELPNVLIVFNHPNWDLYKIGARKHEQRREDFLAANGRFLHAFELNGLRNWEENRSVKHLADRYGKLLISGGDRHGMEPNANVNLTRAGSFNEFVNELRREKRSHLLFMPQYAQPWKHRIFQSTLDAIRDYPDFPEGSQRWDERVYHQDREGVPRPLSELWPHGNAPVMLQMAIRGVRLMGRETLSRGLRFAWEEREQHLAFGEGEAS